ncbi:MAG: leucine-rich repeat protein [Lachnospiraceae bacterium]|nr:leucine-rich repeat protein [Lachnospiraceae bacterium]
MSSLQSILYEIKPCDLNSPYIFISYSSLDSELVWQDVREFQRRGYNVWLDEKNLDKTKPSWREDAIAAIEDMECELVVFYVSANSLRSNACYQEMLKTVDERTRAMHFGPVKFVAIDAEPVGDITTFAQKVFREIRGSSLEKEERSRQALALDGFMRDFFNSNNEKVRIHPKNEANRKIDYYDDIMASFPDSARVFEPEMDEKTVAVPEPEMDEKPEPELKLQKTPEPEVKPQAFAEPEEKPHASPDSEPKPPALPEPEAKPQKAPEPEVKPQAVPEPEAKPQKVPEPETAAAEESEKEKAAIFAVRKNLAAAHPDWDSKRLYAVARAIVLEGKKEKKKTSEERREADSDELLKLIAGALKPAESQEVKPEPWMSFEDQEVKPEPQMSFESQEVKPEPRMSFESQEVKPEPQISSDGSVEEVRTSAEDWEPIEEYSMPAEKSETEQKERTPEMAETDQEDEMVDDTTWFTKSEGTAPAIRTRMTFGKKEMKNTPIRGGVLEIPENYTEIQVKLGHSLYWGNREIRDLILPASLKELNIGEFQNCVNLEQVLLPKYLQKIPSEAFRECSSLKEIVIPGNVTVINHGAFRDCVSLAKVVLPEQLKKVDAHVFEGCRSLQEIHLPSGLKTLSMHVFAGCTSLKDVCLPPQLEKMDICCFTGCTSLETVHIPGSLKRIASSAFKNCSSLKKVTIEEGVERIDGSFDRCGKEMHIYIPDSVTSIDSIAFYKSTPVIHCHAGSYAESYAKKNSLMCQLE